jgi:uncharacterized protein YciI
VKYVMFYEPADDFLPKARRYGAAHRARLEQFHARGLLLLAGPLLDPMDGSAMGVFTSREAAEEFVSGDPFMLHGVVRSRRIRQWDEFLDRPDDQSISGARRPGAAARRAGVEFVEKTPHNELTRTDTTVRNAGMLRRVPHRRIAFTWLLAGAPRRPGRRRAPFPGCSTAEAR